MSPGFSPGAMPAGIGGWGQRSSVKHECDPSHLSVAFKGDRPRGEKTCKLIRPWGSHSNLHPKVPELRNGWLFKVVYDPVFL